MSDETKYLTAIGTLLAARARWSLDKSDKDFLRHLKVAEDVFGQLGGSEPRWRADATTWSLACQLAYRSPPDDWRIAKVIDSYMPGNAREDHLGGEFVRAQLR